MVIEREVEYVGERRTSNVRSKIVELCADGGKRKVLQHEWGLEREVTNFPTGEYT